ncbi:RNA polymerase I-specific transcription initiation factor RRN3 [Gadus chalcogrammus]|uniref:RNA polymerase I-specific transcription initiation factor RRN3 n=1 Tax=Gadus chalcogrammus TaxID=1042646 RepID=UPI0024C46D99|nr:RNA polymerase I-specific transcription initiation factor RRN3 [Gadus chalcogrammus]
MEIDGRDFLNTPPTKTVRFGGSVVATLAKYKQGDLQQYELLKHQLSDPDIKDGQIINWLQEFRSCVTLLGKDHEHLIHTILRLPWLGRSPAVIEEYLAFLGNLVSAQTVFLCACLKMVVSHFIPKRVKICEGGVDISDSDDDDDENLARTFGHCHQALQVILRYVPSTSHFLVPILNEKFPFVQKSSRTLECYVHNLLRVTVYIPTIQRDVLEIVIGKMLKLDVSAPRASIEEAEERSLQHQSELTEEGLFDMDEDEAGEQGSGLTAHPMAEKLDSLMMVTMSYIRDSCLPKGALDVERTKELFRDLLSIFDKLILPTHASCHVQYILFYLCSFRVALAEAFLEHLWKVFQNPSFAPVLRQAAAGYIGSLLARASFLPVVTVRACVDLLVQWIHGYIDSLDAGGRQACCDVTLHGPFYTACQAVFYALIFRHRAILEVNMKKGLAYLQGLNLERVVMCQLNPLNVCLPAVINLFAAFTRKYQVAFCYTVIEKNNRQMLPVVRSSNAGGSVATNTNPLDSFFPFDPYLLKRSSSVIQPLYQVWEEAEDSEEGVAQRETLRSMDEEDDFLNKETPHSDPRIMGMTPGSYDRAFPCSPCSVGSPPVGFP